ncbi:uncharacterized protein EKO05_0009284 [Ascochyta rabiei]|uniref:uncharacterized protein n=1 Tax=Didymella rabiei TaxID=5454 RepID=UPI00190138A1|nr:uncharacterized protein EKO05_0009284 [Ascochyta rabiei]UPX19007.1 hypothetical protein EKO05_0009284 [Ascochyta rabiei]
MSPSTSTSLSASTSTSTSTTSTNDIHKSLAHLNLHDSAVLPRQPWNVPAGEYVRTDGTVIYIGDVFLYRETRERDGSANWSHAWMGEGYSVEAA